VVRTDCFYKSASGTNTVRWWNVAERDGSRGGVTPSLEQGR